MSCVLLRASKKEFYDVKFIMLEQILDRPAKHITAITIFLFFRPIKLKVNILHVIKILTIS